MSKKILRRRLGGLIVLMLLTGGCSRQDTEKLGNIGRIIARRTENLASRIEKDLTKRWNKASQGRARR